MQETAGRRSRVWPWLGLFVLAALLVFSVATVLALRHAPSILKNRIVHTLSARFNSDVQLDTLQVSLTHGLDVTGTGLRVQAPDEQIAAGVTYPLFTIRQFSFHARLLALFFKPMHVGMVQVTGLAIHIPPSELRGSAGARRRRLKEEIRVDQIVCDDSALFIDTIKPGKDPRIFRLQRIVLRDVGNHSASSYDATLVNPLPRGLIHAWGSFGPWHQDSPGDSPLDGHYTFDHADLNTIQGLGGMLSSTGSFSGQLNRIFVDGTTDVPNFSLDTGNHAMPLQTSFHAVVDGTTGDTYLQPVAARLGHSAFTCSGAITNTKGQGHTTDLQVHIPGGDLTDFLTLVVHTQPPVLSGIISTRSTLHIPPGRNSVTHRIAMRGTFSLTHIRFSQRKLQDQVDMLSLRAQGDPQDAQPGAPYVSSRISGAYALRHASIDFSRLDYLLPGATAHLTGTYTLDGKIFDFRGNVRTQAKLSQMTASWWKAWLLKGADPFFHKHGAGAEIPIKITGTSSAPKVGLDLGHKTK